MAIYTTLFLCKPEELQTGFPGWKLPLEQPVRREFRNPFTSKVTVIETREPEWPSEETSETLNQEFRAAMVRGRFEDYLEDRLPPFVSGCPHWAAKGLTSAELDPLLHAAGVVESFERPIYGPPSRGASVQQLPRDFIDKMMSIDRDAVVEKWAAEMSTPKHTHSVSGKRILNGWTTDQAAQILNPIISLVKKVTDGQLMYLLVEA